MKEQRKQRRKKPYLVIRFEHSGAFVKHVDAPGRIQFTHHAQDARVFLNQASADGFLDLMERDGVDTSDAKVLTRYL